MIRARTLSAPSASAASVATRLESTPPLKPRTTRSNLTFRTSLLMKPTRMRRTSSGVIRSGGKAGSEMLTRALTQEPAEIGYVQLEPIVAQQWIGEALQPAVPQIEVG